MDPIVFYRIRAKAVFRQVLYAKPINKLITGSFGSGKTFFQIGYLAAMVGFMLAYMKPSPIGIKGRLAVVTVAVGSGLLTSNQIDCKAVCWPLE